MRIAAVLPSVLVALGGAGPLLGCAGAPSEGPATMRQPPRLVSQARERAQRSASQVFHHALNGRQARLLTRRLSRTIPLPAGGNFNGIRWETAAGPIPSNHLEPVLESNAMCQWLRAVQEGRHGAIADQVVRLATEWPYLRGSQARPAAEVVTDCYASHRRETSYARRLGRQPST